MPRFFFHVHDDDDAFDEEGRELPDFATARAEAIRSARALARDEVSRGRLNLSHRIEVADECGVAVAIVTFGDAIDVTN